MVSVLCKRVLDKQINLKSPHFTCVKEAGAPKLALKMQSHDSIVQCTTISIDTAAAAAAAAIIAD
jgi:hypothetical protein